MSSNGSGKVVLPALAFDHEDSGSDPIFTAIGEAIGAWAALEFQVSNVYLAAAHPHGFPLGAPAGYASVASFDARLKIITNTFSFSLNEDVAEHKNLLGKWARLSQKLRELNLKRNELAHGIHHNMIIDGKRLAGWTPYLNYSNIVMSMQKDWEPPKGSKKLKSISLEEVTAREKAFAKMFNLLDRFIADEVLPVTRQLELFSLPLAKLKDRRRTRGE